MKSISIGIAALVALAAVPAFAADMAVKAPPSAADPAAPFDWSGFYVGVNAGRGRADAAFRGSVNFPGLPFQFAVQPKGDLVGAQIGINRQWGNLVLGVEFTADRVDWTGQAATAPTVLFWTTKLQGLDTLSGRLGYALGNVLVYAKYGGATGLTIVSAVDTGGNTLSQSQRMWGSTAGAGIEYGLTSKFILGVEYDDTRLFPGQFSGTASTGVPFGFGAVHAFDVKSVVGRVSYKF